MIMKKFELATTIASLMHQCINQKLELEKVKLLKLVEQVSSIDYSTFLEEPQNLDRMVLYEDSKENEMQFIEEIYFSQESEQPHDIIIELLNTIADAKEKSKEFENIEKTIRDTEEEMKKFLKKKLEDKIISSVKVFQDKIDFNSVRRVISTSVCLDNFSLACRTQQKELKKYIMQKAGEVQKITLEAYEKCDQELIKVLADDEHHYKIQDKFKQLEILRKIPQLSSVTASKFSKRYNSIEIKLSEQKQTIQKTISNMMKPEYRNAETFTNLKTSLSLLKSLGWMEQQSTELYQDIKRSLGKQFSLLLEEFDSELNQRTIDIDHLPELKSISIILHHMKQIVKIVREHNLQQDIADLEKYEDKSEQDIISELNIIEVKVASLENGLLNQKNYSDLKKAMEYIDFLLKNTRTIPKNEKYKRIKSLITKTLEKQRYIILNFVTNYIDELSLILNNKNQEESIKIERILEQIQNILKIANNVKKNYPDLMKIVDPEDNEDDNLSFQINKQIMKFFNQKLIDDLKRNYGRDHFKTEICLEMLNHFQMLKQQITDENGTIIAQMHNEYQKKVEISLNQVVNKAEMLIQEKQYENLRKEIDVINSQSQQDINAIQNLQQIYKLVNTKVKGLTADLNRFNSQSTNLSHEDAKSSIEIIEELSSILQFVGKERIEFAFKSTDSIMKLYNQALNEITISLREVQSNSKSGEYSLANQQILNTERILEVINYKQYASEEMKHKFEELSSEFKRESSSLDCEIDKKVKLFESEIPPQMYSKKLRPKELEEKIKGNKYGYQANNLKDYVQKNCEKEINKLDKQLQSEMIFTSQLHKDAKKIHKAILNDVQDSIQQFLLPKIENILKQIKKQVTENQQKITKIISGGSIERLIEEVTKNSKFIPSEEVVCWVNRHFGGIIENSLKSIKDDSNLQQKLIQIFEQDLPRLQKIIIQQQICQYLEKDLTASYTILVTELQKVFKKIIENFANYFGQSEKEIDSEEIQQNQEAQLYNYSSAYNYLSILYDQDQQLVKLIIPDYQSQIYAFINTAKLYLAQHKHSFNKAMKNQSIIDIEAIIFVIQAIKGSVLVEKALIKQRSIKVSSSVTKILSQLFDCDGKRQSLFEIVCKQSIDIIIKIREEVNVQDYFNKAEMRSEKQRIEIIKTIQDKIRIVQMFKAVKDELFQCSKFDIIVANETILNAVEEKIIILINDNKDTLIALQRDLKSQNLQKFRQNYVIQQTLAYNLDLSKKLLEKSISDSAEQIKQLIDDLKRKALSSFKVLNELSNSLIQLQRISENVVEFKGISNTEIKEIIGLFKRDVIDKNKIISLALVLSGYPEGSNIVSENSEFKGHEMAMFYDKVNKMKIDDVLSQLKGDNIDKPMLREKFTEFDRTYKQAVKDGLTPRFDTSGNQLPVEIQPVLSQIGFYSDKESKQWGPDQIAKLPKLLANIFALWTLTNATCYTEAQGTHNDKQAYLLQPHSAQIISIFRLLGIGYSKFNLSKNLSDVKKAFYSFFGGSNSQNQVVYDNMVQIKTGEGKSITLAAVSIVFSLHGFDVNCACYSEYLSQRDYQSFESMFTLLGITSQIKYGTFNQLCETYLNKDGNIREIFLKKILVNGPVIKNASQDERPKILMIDEVDVFFSKDFFGAQYRPSAIINGQEVEDLVDFIWNNRTNKAMMTLTQIEASAEYQKCKALFKPLYARLLEEAIKDMVCDVKDFEGHEYVEVNGRIGYKDQDQVSFLINYGYKTMWAYFFESEQGKIPKHALKEQKTIGINCGEFSYAEIPHKYNMILGVSGTLETLTAAEKKIVVEEYKIQNMTYTPSVYGESGLVFSKKQDIIIESSSLYFSQINQNIKDHLNTSKGQRAVLVFFKNYNSLMDFYNFDQFQQRDECSILEEGTSNDEKKSIITTATYKGRVTLATKKFGRGTDFICKDKSVLEAGGVHVIQTFLSKEASEEVQIKGRTGRQGDKGSFAMILLDEDLKEFNIEEKEILKNKSNYYKMLKNARNILQQLIKADDTNSLKEKKKQHDEGWEVVQRARNEQGSEQSQYIFNFLFKINRGRALVEAKVTKTLILMDATGSMSSMLSKTKNAVSIMFYEATQLLFEKGIDPKLFEIQFACYRNYSSGKDRILQYSSWGSNPTLLTKFMESITASGGQGNEAVEIGLLHANNEYAKIQNSEPFQILLIGDAPPNTQKCVQEKRISDANWKGTKYAVPTFYQTELAKLKANKVPVFTFFVHEFAKTAFTEIAGETGAECKFLDVNNEKIGQAMLIDLFVSQILQKVGDSNGGRGAELVAAFAAKPKSYRGA